MKVPNSTPGLVNDATLSAPSTTSTYSHKPVSGSTANEVPDLICFSHLRWNFVYQRPQHLLNRAAKNYRVWFIEEPIWSDKLHMSICKQTDRMTVLVPHLPHGTNPDEALRLQRQLLDEFIARERINAFVAWYYTPMALLFSDHLQPSLTVYDCMDELSAFWGAPKQLLEQEKRLIQRAGIMFTGGYSLYEAKKNRHPHVFAFPSSIDFAHFASARKPHPDPTDQRALANPRIGFSGVIDERFDYKLLGELAERRPEWQFVLLGPIVKINKALLPHSPNVHYLGMKAYKDLPTYFSNWDVAILPFALNESTRFISPTKTPEYLAAGLPVVSTPIRDVMRMYGSKEYVQIADSAQTFEAAIEQALASRDSGKWSAIDAFLNENSWDHTWSEMNRLMAAQLSLIVEQ
jgi:glycosyltransferase involved in cell wall biosynthesis